MDLGIEIIGGGLAGLSLALSLARAGVGVRLHEASGYPRHRVCGEFILGLTQEQIHLLGIEDCLSSSQTHCSSAWYVGSRRLPSQHLPYSARGMSRYLLDHRLVQASVAAGAEILTNSRVQDLAPRSGLVLATGRQRQATSRWIGLKAHFSHLPLAAGLEMHLGKGGYAGLSSVEDERVNLCALLPAPLSPASSKAAQVAIQLRKVGLPELADRLANAHCHEESVVGVTHFKLGWAPPDPQLGFVQIGDQLGIIPPFTGAGMSMAFESAAVAQPFLLSYARGQETWLITCQKIAEAQTAAFSRRMRWAQAIHPLILSPLSQSLLAVAATARALPFRWLTHRLRRP